MPIDDDFDLSSDLDSLSLDDFSKDDDLILPELEENSGGVWVKSAQEEAAPIFDSDALSSEELDKIGSDFDLVVASETPLEGETLDDDGVDSSFLVSQIPNLEDAPVTLDDFSDADFSIKDDSSESLDSFMSDDSTNFDEISLDDFVSFDEDDDPSGGVKPTAPSDESAIPSEKENKEEFLDIDISIEDDVDDQELEIIEGANVRGSSFLTEDITGAEEVDLSEFTDVSFDSSIGGVSIEEFNNTEDGENKDLEELSSEGFFDEGTLEEDFDFETNLSKEDPPALEKDSTNEDDSSFNEEPFFELGNESDFSDDFETVLSQEKDQAYDISVEPEEPDMASIQALEDDLTKGIRDSTHLHSKSAESILQKIEQELLSIKNEISSIKNEMTNLKPSYGLELPTNHKPAEEKGFFSDDEDEVIALTGDELDNILSSAEITSDAGDSEFIIEDDDSDLISTDEVGNISLTGPEYAGENESQTDVDLFSGTELEESLEDDIHVPETEMNNPIPGSKDMNSIPEDLNLEPLSPEDKHNVLNMDESNGDLPSLNLGDEEINLDDDMEISFDLEDQDSEIFMEDPQELTEQETTLEIPLDEDLMGASDEEANVEEIQEDLSNLEDFDYVLETPEETSEKTPTTSELPGEKTAPSVLTDSLKEEIRTVLSYMDKLLENLPDDKIKEFADSEHFEVYKKLFEELGLSD